MWVMTLLSCFQDSFEFYGDDDYFDYSFSMKFLKSLGIPEAH